MRTAALSASLILVLAGPALAEQDDKLRGSVEIGYRSADVNGEASKYREDVNQIGRAHV